MNTETKLHVQPATPEKSTAPQWQATRKKRPFSTDDSVYDSILWRLSSRRSDEQTMAVGITGCKSKSGATTVATKLALHAGSQQVGRVLLIDANRNSPTMKKTLGLAPNSGLYDVLSGEVAPRECEPEQIAENVFVLSAGDVQSTADARVDRQLAAEMMEQFRLDYDLILVDLPPAKDLRSALPVAKSLDGVLLVTRSESVKQPEVQRIAQQLQQDNVELWGAVLNRHREYVPRWLQKWL
ncbi:MAG: CpsD/CapB family tyrosine-protein kinase [Planctomycetes bacterium]|nr:CpsD/CapB family tyrosine-protein kinase [Planctomycetota bacterium]